MYNSPEGGPPSPSVSSHSVQNVGHRPTPAPRWPLKPGVLVHVNRTHSLRSGLGSRIAAADSLGIIRTNGLAAERAKDPGGVARSTPLRPFRRQDASIAGRRRPLVPQDEGVLARANKIRAMLGAQLKEPDAGFPGISRGKSGKLTNRLTTIQIPHPSLPDLSFLSLIYCEITTG